MSIIPETRSFDTPSTVPDELQAFAECLWTNQANLIKSAADHFGLSPPLVATLLLPVLFQAMAGAFADKAELRAMVGEAIDKGFDDWLRNAPARGGVQ